MFVLKVIGIILLSLIVGVAIATGLAGLFKHIEILPSYVEFFEEILDNLGINFLAKIS